VVSNSSNRQAVYSDAGGAFSIPAQEGDKLLLSFVGYNTLQWQVTQTGGSGTPTIYLSRLAVQLHEFVLRPKYKQYQIDSAARRDVYARALARQKGGSLASPVSFIAEKFSKRSKEIYRFQKGYNYWEDQKFIDMRYSPQLVQELTNLTGDTLAHFMNAYPMPADYARTASDLEFKMTIRNNFKDWMRQQAALPADSLRRLLPAK
jgi:hypothetical protein